MGAGLGAATSKDRAKGAAAGAAGAFVAETVAEAMSDDPATMRAKAQADVRDSGRPMTDKNLGNAFQARVQTAMNWGTFAAGFVALATGMDVSTALFTAANALHNNFATTAQRDANTGGAEISDEERAILKEIEECQRIHEDMKKDAEESGSFFKKTLCFLSGVIRDVDGDFMTDAAEMRLRLHKIQKDTPRVFRDGFQFIADYLDGKPVDSNALSSYMKLVDGWVPHMTSFVVGAAGAKSGFGRNAPFNKNRFTAAHKPGSSGTFEHKGKQRTSLDGLGLEKSINRWEHDQFKTDLRYREFASASRVGSALKADIYHRGTSLGLDPSRKIHSFNIIGKEGNSYVLCMQKTTVNGSSGVFEYILNPKGHITHQRFKPGAKPDGKPN